METARTDGRDIYGVRSEGTSHILHPPRVYLIEIPLGLDLSAGGERGGDVPGRSIIVTITNVIDNRDRGGSCGRRSTD